MVERKEIMYIVVLHRHSFTQYEYYCKNIAWTGVNYVITDTDNQTHTFSTEDYLVAITG